VEEQAVLKLDGKSLAKQMEEQIRERTSRLFERTGRRPVLATLLVGDDPASATYVRMKVNACERVGMGSRQVVLPADTTEARLLGEIDRLNRDPEVNGILLQHPVPSHIDERRCFDAIALSKDVDGVTTHGFGRMAMGCRAMGSATPAGIMNLLSHYKLDVSGLHAVVVGRSPILGKPMAMMLLEANATVTICHSRTRNLSELVRQADLVVGAVGKPKFIKGAWIKDGAIVVDAGYHPGGVGDIELEAVVDRCKAFTPVPGGVGPMTISALIRQTLEAAEEATQTQ
jgi:methylenetetrahydrofolate dehydrogenase (NADP+)/methenyltetrahydrofolate cyclohydrolase